MGQICSEINRARFLCKQPQGLLPGDAPAPAPVASGAANPGHDQALALGSHQPPDTGQPATVAKNHKLRNYNPLFKCFSLSNSFATAHWYLQPIATRSHRPGSTGASWMRPFPKSGTDWVAQHSSRVPCTGTPASCLLWGLGCVPKGTVPLCLSSPISCLCRHGLGRNAFPLVRGLPAAPRLSWHRSGTPQGPVHRRVFPGTP